MRRSVGTDRVLTFERCLKHRQGDVEPLARVENFGGLILVLGLVEPDLSFDQALEQGHGGLGVLVHPVRAHGEVFLRVRLPNLGGGGGQVTDVVLDDARRPGITGGEGLHRAVLHALQGFRCRHLQQFHRLVGVHPSGGEPVADPDLLVGLGEGVGGLEFAALLLAELVEEARRRGFQVDGEVAILDAVRGRDAIALAHQHRQDHHRHLLAIGDRALADHLGHRQLPLAAIDATTGGAQHQVVAGGAPAGLLAEVHLQAMLGEEAFLHPDHQGGGFEDRDVAEADGLHLQVGVGHHHR